jgi:hypothetical protein
MLQRQLLIFFTMLIICYTINIYLLSLYFLGDIPT